MKKSRKKIGIIDADLLDNGTRHPNLALMKISGYYKAQGKEVELLMSYDNLDDYEQVYISKVFTFTNVPNLINNAKNVKVGGTGFFGSKAEDLPYEIEHHMPDYDLYIKYVDEQVEKGKNKRYFKDYLDYSIGFSTRGCFRKCTFCVNKKYNKVFRHSSISEFYDPRRKYIYLWDDNFLGFSGWAEILDEVVKTGRYFQFRQGLDIRLLTEEKAIKLSQVKYHGDFIFAFDNVADKELISRKLELWRNHCKKTTKLYLFCAYESQDENDIERIFIRLEVLMKFGCLPYLMRYEDYLGSKWEKLYITLARWMNQPQFYKMMSFKEFCERNQFYCKTDKTCSSMQSMIDFEREHPQIASRYFDLKFMDLHKY